MFCVVPVATRDASFAVAPAARPVALDRSTLTTMPPSNLSTTGALMLAGFGVVGTSQGSRRVSLAYTAL